MKPAIKVARDGWTVGPDLLSYMKSATSTYDFLTYDPSWAIDFAPNGTRLGLGDTITRRRYSDTLETISKRGADAFYTGPIANATINALRRQNGTMTLKDLADYKAKSRKALEINYRDYRVVSCGAPSSGVVGLSALKVVEGYKDLGEQKALNISTHRLDEAIRFGYGEVRSCGYAGFAREYMLTCRVL